MAIILALLAAAAVTPQHDYVVVSGVTTAELVRECADAGVAGELRTDFCTGYVAGVLDVLSTTKQVCPVSGGPTTLQAVAVTRKYIADHPEEWGVHPSFLVSSVLRKTFPCAGR